jgi:hypothetical protein
MSVADDTQAIQSLADSYAKLLATERQFSTYQIEPVLKAINALASRIERATQEQ